MFANFLALAVTVIRQILSFHEYTLYRVTKKYKPFIFPSKYTYVQLMFYKPFCLSKLEKQISHKA